MSVGRLALVLAKAPLDGSMMIIVVVVVVVHGDDHLLFILHAGSPLFRAQNRFKFLNIRAGQLFSHNQISSSYLAKRALGRIDPLLDQQHH